MNDKCSDCGEYSDNLQKTTDGDVCPLCLEDYNKCENCENMVFHEKGERCDTCGDFHCNMCIDDGSLKQAEDFDDKWFCSDGCYDELDWNDDYHKDIANAYSHATKITRSY